MDAGTASANGRCSCAHFAAQAQAPTPSIREAAIAELHFSGPLAEKNSNLASDNKPFRSQNRFDVFDNQKRRNGGLQSKQQHPSNRRFEHKSTTRSFPVISPFISANAIILQLPPFPAYCCPSNNPDETHCRIHVSYCECSKPKPDTTASSA